MRKRRGKKKLIDTEVESAMRSNSGKKKKKKKRNFQKEEGGGETRKEAEGGGKKKPTASRAQLFFFLKEEKFRVRSLGYPALGAPLSPGPPARGGGAPPFVSLRARLCDITHSTLFGVLVVVLLLFFVGQEGGLDFLFLQAGAERSPSLAPGLRFPS